ncbi:MAG: LysR family transcriptional regulator [Caulobacteraceae bacterium]|nr:LysR family transcriptional regulator [Caulobacteraceae bacterium]
MDEISDLRLFVRLVAAGSLSEAARRLNSSPPAMSRRLAALEARLGVRLIDRDSRRFSPTEEGGQLYERALRILAEVDEAEAEASAGGALARGRLRIGAPIQMGRNQIAPMIADFLALYPQIQVDLVLSDAGQDVIDDHLDVALRLEAPSDPSIIARRLVSSRRVLCASPHHLARSPPLETPADLAQHDCIRLIRGHEIFDRWPFAIAGARQLFPVRGSLTTNSGEVLHQWILAGLGLGMKIHWDVRADLQAGRLVECLPAYACDDVDLYATYPTRSYLPPRVRAFIDFVAARIRDPIG